MHFRSSHPQFLKKNILKGLWLRAMRILIDHPHQLALELAHLRATFASEYNNYPSDVLDCWFADFEYEARCNLHILLVLTRLSELDIFDESGQQKFSVPAAELRFPVPVCNSEQINRSAANDLISQEAMDLALDAASQIDATGTLLVDGDGFELAQPTLPTNTIVPPVNADSNDLPTALEILRQPTMILPYLPGLSDRLKRLAAEHQIRTWFTYPGNTFDKFNAHRGQIPRSKTRFAVYGTECKCGLQYIGESNRNLKVRLAEHKYRSSQSALSIHLRREKERGNEADHTAAMHNTVIFAREKNNLKRKIIESLVIENKSAKICNYGPSIEIPLIWKLCEPCITRQLAE